MNRRSFFVWTAGLGLLLTGTAASQTIRIEPGKAAAPLPHFWEAAFGSGRAVLSLRESYRRNLDAVRAATDFRYVRFHAIFHDENGVYSEDASGNPVYNFNQTDQIYDGLLAHHVKPYVELSFMPRQLAASAALHSFWYRPVVSPPKDYRLWGALVEAFARHLAARYGIEELSSWYFEVWNEPNIDFWAGEPKFETYMQLYEVAARALKRVSPRLRVGGPATAQAAWTGRFLDECARRGLAADFVSTHVYANDRPEDVFGKAGPEDRRAMLGRAVDKVYHEVRSSALPATPIHWSEFNASYRNEPEVTDSAYMGPWLAETIARARGKADLMSFWTFSDDFEEQGIFKSPFYGGFGLVNPQGIPKAAFHAFRLLHLLGEELLAWDENGAMVTRRRDGRLVAALWNYAEPGVDGPDRTFTLAGAPAGAALVHRVDRQHGSAFDRWKQMGAPRALSPAQQRELEAVASAPPPERIRATGGVLTVTVPAHGLAVVELGVD